MKQLDQSLLTQVITKRPSHSHKGDYGRITVIGGNQQYGGAIMMSAEACVNAGAGLTTVVTEAVNHAPLHARLPEVMVVDWQDFASVESAVENADVLLIGPGLGLDTKAEKLLHFVLQKQQENQWLVIDGSALTLFAQSAYPLKLPNQTIFTPHQMEWQRLSKIAIPEQTPAKNQAVVDRLKTTVVLKKHGTEIYHPQEEPRQITSGNPGMATGGMGDTLAGIIAGFLGQFPRNIETICAAVYLHSFIGDQLAQENYVVLPTKISQNIPYWMKHFETI